MPAKVLDGESLATSIRNDLAKRAADLKSQGVIPGLGTLLVGDDEPSKRYVEMKHADCAEVGIKSSHIHLPAGATDADIKAAVQEFNDSKEVNVFLMQYPFPAGLNYEAALELMDSAKDADGLHPMNLGRLVASAGIDDSYPLPCTPVGILRILSHYEIPTQGANVVIVGRGLTIGKPLAVLLSKKSDGANAAVTCVHTGIPDISAYTRQADILIAAAGSPHIITKDIVKPGATVIAAGVSFKDKKLISDVADDVKEVAGAITPKIGGVGPMTRAMLLSNTIDAAEKVAEKITEKITEEITAEKEAQIRKSV